MPSWSLSWLCSGMVYDDAEKLYAEVHEVCTGLLEDAFGVLLPRSSPLLSNSTSETLVAFNTTSFARHDVIKVPLSKDAARMKTQVIQTSADGKHGYALMHSVGNKVVSQPVGMPSVCTPASGVSDIFRSSVLALNVCYSVYQWNRPLRPQERQRPAHHLRGTSHQPDWRETWVGCVHLPSHNPLTLFSSRELIPKGRSGGLVIFEDRPNYWDAWGPFFHYVVNRGLDMTLLWVLQMSKSTTSKLLLRLRFLKFGLLPKGPFGPLFRPKLNTGKVQSTSRCVSSICHAFIPSITLPCECLVLTEYITFDRSPSMPLLVRTLRRPRNEYL